MFYTLKLFDKQREAFINVIWSVLAQESLHKFFYIISIKYM